MLDETYAFRLQVRKAYNSRRFDELEKIAATVRAGKELTAIGSWKIVQFYDALTCRRGEPESMWELHQKIHHDWIAAKPDSITAHISYAEFLTEHAWHARGTEYANKVKKEGWELFESRLKAAHKMLKDSQTFPEKDPHWWATALTVALGQGWSKADYDALMAQAYAFEPKFWGYDTARAKSLLPRWHGEPGDWEAFAEKSKERPDGLGAETYARVVLSLHGYYDNIFQETKASWPSTKEGLAKMLEKYPRSVDLLHKTAVLACFADDRELAAQMFTRIGKNYLRSAWRSPKQFLKFKAWAESGR